MPEQAVIEDFLAQKRFALVGASRNPKQFANMVMSELTKKGYEIVPVNPAADEIGDEKAYPSVSAIPDPVDGAIVMVARDQAAPAVKDCIAAGVSRVWLHKGLGGEGSVSEEAVQLCRDNDVAVVDGACPIMFAEPVGFGHKVHRFAKQLNKSLPT